VFIAAASTYFLTETARTELADVAPETLQRPQPGSRGRPQPETW
jgi:hypothetical protein